MPHDARTAIPAAACLLGAAALSGCAKDTAATPTPAAPTASILSPQDFARSASDPAPEATEPARPFEISADEAREGISDVEIALGTPDEPAAPGAIPGPPIIQAAPLPIEGDIPDGRTTAIDLMVGQVNGKPIYANDFFAPLDARLRAEAERLPRNQWLRLLTTEVNRIMFERVRDQLLLDEFDQSLTADQRIGVAAFLERLRTRIVSGNLGSELLADESLRREEGLTLDEKVERETDRQVILEQLRREVLRRVNVSFRDVERYYNRNINEFQPIPTAVLRVIRVRLDDAASVEKAEAADTPEAFIALAEEVSGFRRSAGGRFEVELASRDIATTEFFGIEALNEATQALAKSGDTTGRVDTERDAWWVMLEEVVQPEGQSLYDAQNEIEERIRGERFREAEQAYFAELFGRSAVSDLDTMRARLVEYALQTYLGETPDS